MEQISNSEYRSREGVSSTDLKRMVKSPAYYKYCKENPDTGDSEALLFGRAYHKYILETDDFENEFIVSKDFNCSSKEGKKAYAEYVEGIIGRELTEEEKKYKDSITVALISSGKDVISESDFQKIKEMRDVFMSTPYAPLLIKGEHEKSFFWTDDETGMVCKCRPDSFGHIKDKYFAIDLKTCTCAETSKFMKQSIDLGYDIQAAHYVDGLKHHYGKEFGFIFIAQEKTAPYLVNILEADDYFMKNGREVRDVLLEELKHCTETGNFYGYMGEDGEVNQLTVPSWLAKSIDTENTEGGDFE